MAWHPRPLVLVDATQVLNSAVAVALDRIGGWHPVLPASQPAVVRQYLRDAARVGTTPIAMIIRVRKDDASALTLLDWMRAQPAPICSVRILAIDDQVIAEALGDLDSWIEEALRVVLDPGEDARSRAPR